MVHHATLTYPPPAYNSCGAVVALVGATFRRPYHDFFFFAVGAAETERAEQEKKLKEAIEAQAKLESDGRQTNERFLFFLAEYFFFLLS